MSVVRGGGGFVFSHGTNLVTATFIHGVGPEQAKVCMAIAAVIVILFFIWSGSFFPVPWTNSGLP